MATIKLSSRGMIRIKMPAIRATMAGKCAALMTIQVSPDEVGSDAGGGVQNRFEARILASRVPEEETPRVVIRFRASRRLPNIVAQKMRRSGERSRARGIGGRLVGASRT